MKKVLSIFLLAVVLMSLCACMTKEEKAKKEEEKRYQAYIKEFAGKYKEETENTPQYLTFMAEGTVIAEFTPINRQDFPEELLEHFNFNGKYIVNSFDTEREYEYLKITYYVASGTKEKEVMLFLKRTQAGELYIDVAWGYFYRIDN